MTFDEWREAGDALVVEILSQRLYTYLGARDGWVVGEDAAAGLVPLRPYLSTAAALKAIDAQHAEEARCETRDAALVRAIGRMG